MTSAFIGGLEINNKKVKTITVPSADSKYFPVQVQSSFVTGTNEKSSLLWTSVIVEGRGKAIAICMLKGHPERVCDICSKPHSVGGTDLLSITKSVKPYQLSATEGEAPSLYPDKKLDATHNFHYVLQL